MSIPRDLAAAIGKAFSNIDSVEQVYAWLEGDVYNVFTVIADEDEAVYDRIYNQERTLIHQMPVKFDFRVIARRGLRAEDLFGSITPVWQNLCHSATNT